MSGKTFSTAAFCNVTDYKGGSKLIAMALADIDGTAVSGVQITGAVEPINISILPDLGYLDVSYITTARTLSHYVDTLGNVWIFYYYGAIKVSGLGTVSLIGNFFDDLGSNKEISSVYVYGTGASTTFYISFVGASGYFVYNSTGYVTTAATPLGTSVPTYTGLNSPYFTNNVDGYSIDTTAGEITITLDTGESQTMTFSLDVDDPDIPIVAMPGINSGIVVFLASIGQNSPDSNPSVDLRAFDEPNKIVDAMAYKEESGLTLVGPEFTIETHPYDFSSRHTDKIFLKARFSTIGSEQHGGTVRFEPSTSDKVVDNRTEAEIVEERMFYHPGSSYSSAYANNYFSEAEQIEKSHIVGMMIPSTGLRMYINGGPLAYYGLNFKKIDITLPEFQFKAGGSRRY